MIDLSRYAFDAPRRMKSLSFIAGAVSTMDLGFLCFRLWQSETRPLIF